MSFNDRTVSVRVDNPSLNMPEPLTLDVPLICIAAIPSVLWSKDAAVIHLVNGRLLECYNATFVVGALMLGLTEES